jgi:pimeloyl-ACP methyl ester carboxylesterase
MPQFTRDGIQFHFEDTGSGLPFIFQHGLGGDVSQPFGIFKPPTGIRLIAFDTRAHGRTTPVGPLEKLSFHTFGEDLRALLDHLDIRETILGGISMGAALALHSTLRWPDRVRALVLSRPAWLETPLPWNVTMFSLISSLIRQHGAAQGLEEFKRTPEYADTLARWPDVATSFAQQFLNERAEETALKLGRIIQDSPHPDRAVWARVRVPALVLGNERDPVHPIEYAQELARAIPGAEFREITSKAVSLDRHNADVQRVVEKFLRRHLLG